MPPADDDIEALRRSLYRRGTDDAAVARYREAVAHADDREPVPHDRERPRGGVREQRSRLLRVGALVVGAAALVLLGVTASGLAARPPVPTLPPVARPTATVAPLGARTEALGLDRPTRAAIVSALDTGSRAGLAFLFDFHPELRPEALRAARRYGIVELDGTGPGTTEIPIADGARRAGGGRVTVIVVTARGVEASWSVVGIARQPDEPMRPIPIVRLRGEHRSGEPVSASARYRSGGAPDLFSVQVPAGTRWGAAIVFTG